MKSQAQKEKELLEWRRSEELGLWSTGKTITAIAEEMRLDISTVYRDIEKLRKEAKKRQAKYIEEELPFRHRLRMAAMDKAIKEYWALYFAESESKSKRAILDSITDALLKQAALDGDPMALEQALKTVSKMKQSLKEQEQEVHSL